jgi:hypothetical protein
VKTVEENEMDIKNKVNDVKIALADFIIRASKQGATPEEVQALPEVAKIFMGSILN